jgi:Bacterial TSP3 repeat
VANDLSRAIAEVVTTSRRSAASGRRLLIAASLLMLLFGSAPAAIAFLQAPDQASPESGSAQVVAQAVVDVPDGDLVWQVTRSAASPPVNARPQQSALGFLIVQSGVLLAQDLASGEQQRLPAGEATLTRPGTEQLRAALGAETADYVELALQAAAAELPTGSEAVFTSEPFPGLGARHDLDLLQGAMAAGETMELPNGTLPTLIFSGGGGADITIESGEIVPLVSGEAVSFVGPLTITAGSEGADISVVYSGPAVPTLNEGAATPMAVGRVIESTSAAGTPAAGALPAETATAAQASASDDADGDGLTAAEEVDLNTDPELVDTDEDGLSDGDEVHQFTTSPLAPDTDGDGVLDGDEVVQGTDPLSGIAVEEAPVEEAPSESPATEAPPEVAAGVVGDSDGDGLPDDIEASLGTDPVDPDTDDDGLTDGDEYYQYQTGTRNPDSDGDAVVDGDEITNGTNPNDPTSS